MAKDHRLLFLTFPFVAIAAFVAYQAVMHRLEPKLKPLAVRFEGDQDTCDRVARAYLLHIPFEKFPSKDDAFLGASTFGCGTNCEAWKIAHDTLVVQTTIAYSLQSRLVVKDLPMSEPEYSGEGWGTEILEWTGKKFIPRPDLLVDSVVWTKESGLVASGCAKDDR